MSDTTAPAGCIWVCCACGKVERERDGHAGGWDTSCASNAVLCVEESVVYESGRAVKALAMGER